MTLPSQIATQHPTEVASHSTPEPALRRAQAGEWAALFASDMEETKRRTASRQTNAGNPSIACQENGAPDDAELTSDEDEMLLSSAENTGDQEWHSNDKTNDNGILASIMASFTAREKSRVYLPDVRRGLPAEEIERVARTLQDCALAGKPKITLGVVVPELGEIRFDVQIAGKVVFIHAFVDSDQAAAALAAAVSSLRDRLEEHRLVLGRLDVTSPGESEPARNEKPRRRPSRRNADDNRNSNAEAEHASV